MKAEKNSQKSLKKLAIAAIVLVIIAVIVTVTMVVLYTSLPYKDKTMQFDKSKALSFNSKTELNNYYKNLKALSDAEGSFSIKDGASFLKGVTSRAPEDMDTSPNHSETNVQVEGIDEADIVKTNGKYIYKLAEGNLIVIKVLDDSMEVIQTVNLSEELSWAWAKGILLYQDRIIAFYQESEYIDLAGDKDYEKEDTVNIKIFKSKENGNLELDKKITYTGNIIDLRMKDGIIYFALSYQSYSNRTNQAPIPKRYIGSGDDATLEEFAIEEIYGLDGATELSYTIVGKYNLSSNEPTQKAYFGAGSMIYMSHNFLYTTTTDYNKKILSNGLRTKIEYGPYETRIVKIELEGLTVKAVGKVDGTVLNKYCLDEYENNLRIATTSNNGGENQFSNVFVLDGNLTTIGKITDIARGERIYAVRFNKEEGSIVTFKQVDPLFKLDLKDPRSPKISEGLKKEGVSYYLHPINAKYTLGVGRDTTQEGRLKGIELALFDMTGNEAVISDKIVIGDYAIADAIYNPHAFLVDLDNNLFGFAVNHLSEKTSAELEGDLWENSFFVFSFNDSGKIIIKAEIDLIKNEYDSRGIRIDTRLFVIEHSKTTAYDINQDFKQLYSVSYKTGEETNTPDKGEVEPGV